MIILFIFATIWDTFRWQIWLILWDVRVRFWPIVTHYIWKSHFLKEIRLLKIAGWNYCYWFTEIRLKYNKKVINNNCLDTQNQKHYLSLLHDIETQYSSALQSFFHQDYNYKIISPSGLEMIKHLLSHSRLSVNNTATLSRL